MKPRVYDSAAAGKVPKKLDCMIRGQDTVQLASLSASNKQAIHKLQVGHGLGLTDFS